MMKNHTVLSGRYLTFNILYVSTSDVTEIMRATGAERWDDIISSMSKNWLTQKALPGQGWEQKTIQLWWGEWSTTNSRWLLRHHWSERKTKIKNNLIHAAFVVYKEVSFLSKCLVFVVLYYCQIYFSACCLLLSSPFALGT